MCFMLQMQTYLSKITQFCQEICNTNRSNKYIAVQNPRAWAGGTMHKVVLARTKTNKIFNPGIQNQGNNPPPEDIGGACDLGYKLSLDNSVANWAYTHNNLEHHDALHHAPNSPPGERLPQSPPAP